eukprot:scaffold8889_cov100-Isochrysis_galbana.AAC.3
MPLPPGAVLGRNPGDRGGWYASRGCKNVGEPPFRAGGDGSCARMCIVASCMAATAARSACRATSCSDASCRTLSSAHSALIARSSASSLAAAAVAAAAAAVAAAAEAELEKQSCGKRSEADELEAVAASAQPTLPSVLAASGVRCTSAGAAAASAAGRCSGEAEARSSFARRDWAALARPSAAWRDDASLAAARRAARASASAASALRTAWAAAASADRARRSAAANPAAGPSFPGGGSAPVGNFPCRGAAAGGETSGRSATHASGRPCHRGAPGTLCPANGRWIEIAPPTPATRPPAPARQPHCCTPCRWPKPSGQARPGRPRSRWTGLPHRLHSPSRPRPLAPRPMIRRKLPPRRRKLPPRRRPLRAPDHLAPSPLHAPDHLAPSAQRWLATRPTTWTRRPPETLTARCPTLAGLC